MWVHICFCGCNIYVYYNLNHFYSVCAYTYFAYRLHKLNFFNKRTRTIYKTFIDPEAGIISIVQYTHVCAYLFTRFQVSFSPVLPPLLFTKAILIVLWKKPYNQLLSVYIYFYIYISYGAIEIVLQPKASPSNNRHSNHFDRVNGGWGSIIIDYWNNLKHTHIHIYMKQTYMCKTLYEELINNFPKLFGGNCDKHYYYMRYILHLDSRFFITVVQNIKVRRNGLLFLSRRSLFTIPSLIILQ